MVQIKNSEQLAIMRKAGRITGEAILAARDHIREGVSTRELDTVIRHYIEKCGAKPSFLGYGGFPGSACISINNEVIHGIPSASKILHEGTLSKSMSALTTMASMETARILSASEASRRRPQSSSKRPRKAFSAVQRRRSRADGSAISVRRSANMRKASDTALSANMSATASDRICMRTPRSRISERPAEERDFIPV